ncbi:hypothetical protein SV7mr_25090 [Stieleria bergensis]|uniref:Uncharacterized protein n=1 Tax=Stieleria bergensis TaxID=2528025 RepID=A0A517SV40_9BACT|nr:hypothetical protein SV7mr_25090 [Planctomycetes bacterium SV_7m_r]
MLVHFIPAPSQRPMISDFIDRYGLLIAIVVIATMVCFPRIWSDEFRSMVDWRGLRRTGRASRRYSLKFLMVTTFFSAIAFSLVRAGVPVWDASIFCVVLVIPFTLVWMAMATVWERYPERPREESIEIPDLPTSTKAPLVKTEDK